MGIGFTVLFSENILTARKVLSQIHNEIFDESDHQAT